MIRCIRLGILYNTLEFMIRCRIQMSHNNLPLEFTEPSLASRMRSLDSLPLDVIDRILLFLPTFSALRAILLSSKSFNTIFKHHPNSIIRAIAYNITGPALPQAMRLLRTAGDRDLYLVSDPPKHALIAWAETDPISPVERCTLVKNAAVVKALEDLFSSRYFHSPPLGCQVH